MQIAASVNVRLCFMLLLGAESTLCVCILPPSRLSWRREPLSLHPCLLTGEAGESEHLDAARPEQHREAAVAVHLYDNTRQTPAMRQRLGDGLMQYEESA